MYVICPHDIQDKTTTTDRNYQFSVEATLLILELDGDIYVS